MNELSSDAIDLLVTLKRIKKIPKLAGSFIDKRIVLIEYGYDQNSNKLDSLFKELLNASFIKKQSGAFLLLAKAQNWTPPSSSNGVTVYSGIYGSNISHMSTNIAQELTIKNLDEDTKKKLSELIDAVQKNEQPRAQKIIDGLFVSSPALILQILSIGLGLNK